MGMIYDLNFCENCGAELREDDNYLCEECEQAQKEGSHIDFHYCGKCGAKLKKTDIMVRYHQVFGAQSCGYTCHRCRHVFGP